MEEKTDKLFQNPLLRSYVLERRDYQINIAKEALQKNTLVVLPTALGKTIIAALVVAHFLYNYRDKKVLVMAPTRPLVLQHWETFISFLKLKPEEVEVLTGKNSPGYRMKAWEGNARLYFATPQVVENDHERGLKLENFSLLIFDECHRARKNYAYTNVAKAYIRESPYPIILAMTASPGSDRKRIEELCKALFIEHVEIRTEEDSDVSPHVATVDVEWVYVNLPKKYEEIRQVLKKMLDRRLRALVETGAIRKNPKYIFRSDLIELGGKLRQELARRKHGAIFGKIVLQSSALTLCHALELLETQGWYTFQRFIQKLVESKKRGHRTIISELKKEGILEEIIDSEPQEHPKLREVEKIILELFTKNPSSRAIVFTQYRDTSQKIILKRFREGEIKVLVATSIGEEGLDIPSVDLVIFYEPVPSEIRYIQRKGRTGRRNFGRVVILATGETLDVRYLWSSKRKLERMKRVIKRLNTSLNPILRFGSPPKPNPMSPEEIVDVEMPERPASIELEEMKKIRLRRFNREVTQAAKAVLSRIFQKGSEGLTAEELSSELEVEGISPAATSEAIARLKNAREITEVAGRLKPAGFETAKRLGYPSHTFEVEKVMMGRAILIVDNKWRSVLTPQEYTGPRHLIKKGTKFQATAELYKQEGKLHARIHSVQRVLS